MEAIEVPIIDVLYSIILGLIIVIIMIHNNNDNDSDNIRNSSSYL